jgi:glutamate dehydrogenase
MSTPSPQGLQVPGQDKSPNPPASPSRTGSDVSVNKVQNLPGYTTPVFKGKEEQRSKVLAEVASKVGADPRCHNLPSLTSDLHQGFIPRELLANEVAWFYSQLGIDDTYFRNETVQVISDHIIALFGAKVLAYTKHDPSKLAIDLEKIDDNGAVFIHSSSPGETATEGPGSNCETRLVVFYWMHVD